MQTFCVKTRIRKNDENKMTKRIYTQISCSAYAQQDSENLELLKDTLCRNKKTVA